MTNTNTLAEPRFGALIERLHAQADASEERLRDWAATQSPEQLAAWRASAEDYRSLYLNVKDSYLAVSRRTARLLYILTRTHRARTAVEFGTSFGISTLHLAAAIHDNGGGVLIGSEFAPNKVAQARRNLAEAGFSDLTTDIRDGDALDTLAHHLPETIDLVFLDGAKQIYLPILRLLEPHMPSGALLIADNTEHAPDYLQHVRDSNTYESTGLGGHLEISLRTSID